MRPGRTLVPGGWLNALAFYFATFAATHAALVDASGLEQTAVTDRATANACSGAGREAGCSGQFGCAGGRSAHGDAVTDEARQILWIQRCLIATLVGADMLCPDNLVGHLKIYAASHAHQYGTDELLMYMADAVREMAKQKRDVDQRLAVSIDIAPTQNGARN